MERGRKTRRRSACVDASSPSPPEGCVDWWIMPFISRYRLSTGGTDRLSCVTGREHAGYRSSSQRKKKGTPIAEIWRGRVPGSRQRSEEEVRRR